MSLSVVLFVRGRSQILSQIPVKELISEKKSLDELLWNSKMACLVSLDNLIKCRARW